MVVMHKTVEKLASFSQCGCIPFRKRRSLFCGARIQPVGAEMTVLLERAASRAPAWSLPVAIVATACGFVVVVRGAAETFGVFIHPLEQGLGLGHAETAGIYALSMLAIGVGGPFAGALADRFGPRLAYAIGATTLTAAFAAASLATALWQLQLALGIGVGVATTCVSISCTAPGYLDTR
ncbi:MAG: MFS transporter [Alphaproteobacteria bacterium]|nr:MFS transporter [Alphaproteobacteria bacterium]